MNRMIILIIIIVLVLLLLYLTRKESIDYFENATDGYKAACAELTRKRTFLYMYLNYLKAPVQDLSNTLINIFMGKDESMSFQYALKEQCLATTPMSYDCMQLASVDAGIFKVLPDIDIFYNNLLYGQADLNNLLQKLNNYSTALGCSAASIDGKGKINPMDLSNNNLNMDKDIGIVDTQTTALELEKLSPYYLSPDVVRFLIRFLISQEELGHLHDTSKQYLATQTKLVPLIIPYFNVTMPGPPVGWDEVKYRAANAVATADLPAITDVPANLGYYHWYAYGYYENRPGTPYKTPEQKDAAYAPYYGWCSLQPESLVSHAPYPNGTCSPLYKHKS